MSKFDSPLVELDVLLQRVEERLLRSKHDYIESIRPHEENGQEKKSFFGFRRTAATTPKSSPAATPPSSSHPTTTDSDETRQLLSPEEEQALAPSSSSVEKSHREPDPPENKSTATSTARARRTAKFIEIPDTESFIEDLRRIAELVVIGENYVTSCEKKVQKEFEKSRERWSQDRDLIADPSADASFDANEATREPLSPDFADVFDLFFERNTLATLVNLLTGQGCFDTPDIHDTVAKAQETAERNGAKGNHKKKHVENHILLPPLDVATQTVQSISIIVQNVSRATSLYILFSNDYINNLIQLNLDQYEQAERSRRLDRGESPGKVHASPEVAELTTHFVTFLKSLALRMNVETLQFFLQYPEGHGEESAKSTVEKRNSWMKKNLVEGYDPKRLTVHFPLYDRALDFCAAHQDSFVRVTAMNICLNTIRLTTVSEPIPEVEEENLEEEEGAFGSAIVKSSAPSRSTSTPDVAIHKAMALPFRERLAIAQHTCTPSRVERLIAPIFTKLSERWTSLDEAIRGMDDHDMNKGASGEGPGADGVASARREKVAQVREKVKKEKLTNLFRDRAADLQDELLLLEDVFKVGLTVLNEQMIEMMFATFVYPLLLQPLILFSQRFTATVLNGTLSIPTVPTLLDHPFGAPFTGDHSKARASLAPVTGPAKTALFTMASAFQFLTNPPLLRLMFTALLHPISPDSTTVPTVRSSLQVASVDVYGRGIIRIDSPEEGDIVPDSRQSYPFGTNEINRRASSSKYEMSDDSERSGTEEDACVFVLAPALAEVLEFRGQDYGVIARTRPNSYRHALLQCLQMETPEFSQMKELAVCTLDAALARLDPKLATDLLFGVNMKTFTDDIPMDERNLDSNHAYQENDRGLGGSVAHQSRHSITSSRNGAVGSNLIGQVVSPLVSAALFAKRGWNREWKLALNDLACHSLMLISKGNSNGLLAASKTIETRRNQASKFLAQIPELMHSPRNGGSSASSFLVGVPHVNAPDFDQQIYGAIMNVIVHGVAAGEVDAPIEKFLQLQKDTSDEREEGFSVAISSQGGFNEMTTSITRSFLADLDAPDAGQRSVTHDFEELRGSVAAFFKADAFLSLMKDLSATGGLALRSFNPEGIALSRDGTFVQTSDWKHSKKVFSPISLQLEEVLLSAGGVSSTSVAPGTTLKLAGYPAIPCVCEAPASLAHLFDNQGSGIVAQGVTWQSLYLVFKGGWMIFAQPIPGGASGEGRVIGACLLERTYVDKDMAPVDNGSPARRLLFAYATFDPNPPPLFLYDELPEKDKSRPLAKAKSFISNLDVWCENERAADYAYQVASSQIFAAKSQRGRRIQSFLAPEKYR